MYHQSIGLGVRRGLSQCASPDGIFCILALDHRRALINTFTNSGNNAFDESITFKKQVVRALSPYSTAFLLDPVLGAAPTISDYTLPGACGLIVSVEDSGYAGSKTARVSRLPGNWNVEKIKRMGASAVKLLVYFNPSSETASLMKELLFNVTNECKRYDLPLFLEILTYSSSKDEKPLSGGHRTDTILKSVEELTPTGGDILKVEFPGNNNEKYHDWENACRSISQASHIPWVLLSAGVESDLFLEQTEVACASGASGILGGRAIWKEALHLDGEERLSFLSNTAKERLANLYEICASSAKPWTDFYPPYSMPADWQDHYAGF